MTPDTSIKYWTFIWYMVTPSQKYNLFKEIGGRSLHFTTYLAKEILDLEFTQKMYLNGFREIKEFRI